MLANLHILALLGLMILVPGAAFAQTTDEFAEPATPPAIEPEDDTVGPVGIVDELMLAHSDLTDIMLRQSIGDFDTPDLPFVMTYVDEENGELVVVMDSIAALVGIEFEEEEVRIALGRDVQVKILYGAVVLDASPSRAQQWTSLYKEKCVPVRPGYQSTCNVYAGILRGLGVDPSTLGSTTTSRTLSTQDPCNINSRSLACYYYGQYQNRCIPTKTTSRCSTYATQIESAGFAVPTRAAVSDTTPPTITVPRTITKTTSDSTGSRVYYSVSASDNVDRTVSVSCTHNSGSKFSTGYTRVSCSATDNAGNKSTRSFYVIVRYSAPDTTSPVITVPNAIIKTTSDPTGLRVYYSVSASDNKDGRVSASCSPSSGSKFSVGSTTVSCTARDSAGNRANERFGVSVTYQARDTTAPVITVPNTITRTTNDSTGRVVTYSVSASDNVDGAVTPTCNPSSGSKFSTGSTTVSCTATDNAGNSATKRFVVTVTYDPDAEFYGGDRFLSRVTDSSDNEVFDVGTITIGATTSNNIVGMVVSGHVTEDKPDDEFISYEAQHGSDQSIVSTEIASYYVRGVIDAAFIPITEPDVIVHDKIRAHDDTIINVKYGRLADVERLQQLYIYGTYINSQGSLLFKNATVRDLGNIALTNLGVASYNSTYGDSGAPIVHHDDVARIVGSHLGGICAFEPQNQSPIDVTGNTNLCNRNSDRYYYKIFSAWENVVDLLDLQ